MPQSKVLSFKRIIKGDMTPFNIAYKDGLYYLYYAERRGLTSYISRLLSTDLINWEYGGDIAADPFIKGTGSALFRNGKVYVAYERGVLPEVRTIYSRDGFTFEKYPIAAKGKPFIKNPRVFYSGGAYYMLTGGKGVRLFRSDNLFDWKYVAELFPGKAGNSYISPSIIRLSGKNFIVYGEKSKKGEASRIAECDIDVSTGRFSLVGGAEELPLLFPRTSTLKDGRVILTGYVKPQVTVINELDYAGGIIIKPLKELIEKRREGGELIRTVIGRAKYEGAVSGEREIILTASLEGTDFIEITTGGGFGAAYDKKTGIFSLASGEKRLSVFAGIRDRAEFDIVIASGIVEGYFGGKYLALAAEDVAPGIEIKVSGEAVISLTEYRLDIDR